MMLLMTFSWYTYLYYLLVHTVNIRHNILKRDTTLTRPPSPPQKNLQVRSKSGDEKGAFFYFSPSGNPANAWPELPLLSYVGASSDVLGSTRGIVPGTLVLYMIVQKT